MTGRQSEPVEQERPLSSPLQIIICLITALCIVTYWVGYRLFQDDLAALPRVLRITQTQLGNLPVRFDATVSCGCWHGPREQAQKKFKFKITNNYSKAISLDGGPNSDLRLLVAYPKDFTPVVKMPDPNRARGVTTTSSPPNVEVDVTDDVRSVHPTEIVTDGDSFGVPTDFRLWAIPPNPNLIVEPVRSGDDSAMTFPTYVTKHRLEPGETYFSRELATGAWVFYVPLPSAISIFFSIPVSLPMQRGEMEEHVIVVGVAVFDASTEQMVGLAPMPSESSLSDPNMI